jgi:Nucleotidyl transferase AbiEii toxin, Type IV TA system
VRRYRTPEAFRQALAERLTRHASDQRTPFEVVRRRLVFQRLMARLMRVGSGNWVVTGGAALDWRLAQRFEIQRARTTVDLDFLYRATAEQAFAELMAATQVDLHDYFEFRVGLRTRPPEPERGSMRYHMVALLGAVPYLDFAVDIGVLDPLRWPPDQILVSAVLDDPDFGPLHVPALPIPHQLAEKVHALTRTLKDGARRTRAVKDLVDIVRRTRTMESHASPMGIVAAIARPSDHALSAPMQLPEL